MDVIYIVLESFAEYDGEMIVFATKSENIAKKYCKENKDSNGREYDCYYDEYELKEEWEIWER